MIPSLPNEVRESEGGKLASSGSLRQRGKAIAGGDQMGIDVGGHAAAGLVSSDDDNDHNNSNNNPRTHELPQQHEGRNRLPSMASTARSSARSARIKREFEKRRTRFRWYLHYDDRTQTVRRVWTRFSQYRIVLLLGALFGLGLGLGLGIIAASHTTYYEFIAPTDPSAPLVIDTNACDLYFTSDKLTYDFTAFSHDGYTSADIPPCTTRCAAIKADHAAYDFRRENRLNGLRYDPATNKITVLRTYTSTNTPSDESRGARCKMIVAWDGDIVVNLLAGPGKVNIITHPKDGTSYKSLTVNAPDPTGFAFVYMQGATASNVAVNAARGHVVLRNVTVSNTVAVSLGTGTAELMTSNPVQLETNTGACLSAARVERRTVTGWDLYNTAEPIVGGAAGGEINGTVAQPLPATATRVVVSATIPDMVDLAVNVWSSTPSSRGDGWYSFETATVSRLPTDFEIAGLDLDDGESTSDSSSALQGFATGNNNNNNNTNSSATTTSTTTDGTSTAEIPVARAVLTPAGSIPGPAFRGTEKARLRKMIAEASQNPLAMIYMHGTGLPRQGRPIFHWGQWVTHKLSGAYESLLTLGIMAPSQTVTHATLARGFCPAHMRTDAACSTEGKRSTGTGTGAGRVPVFGCHSPLTVYKKLDAAVDIFRPLLTGVPGLEETPIFGTMMVSLADPCAQQPSTLVSKEEKEVLCPAGESDFPIAMLTGDRTIVAMYIALLVGARPLLTTATLLSMAIAVVIAAATVWVTVHFTTRRFMLFRMDTLIQDGPGRSHLRKIVAATARHFGPRLDDADNDDDGGGGSGADDGEEYDKFDLSRTRRGELSIGNAVSSSFVSRLTALVRTKGGASERPSLWTRLTGMKRFERVQKRRAALGPLGPDVIDSASRLLRKLLLLERSSSMPFLVDAAVPSLRGPSEVPQVEEAVYWLKAHTLPREVQVVILSVVVCLLPGSLLLYPGIVLGPMDRHYRDQYETSETLIFTMGLVGLSLASFLCMVLVFSLYLYSRTGYEVRKWRKGGIYAGKGRSRLGGGDGKPAYELREMHVPERVRRAREDEAKAEAAHYDAPVAPRALTLHNITKRATQVLLSVVLLAFILSIFLVFLLGQWVLLGLFIFPQKAGPFAAGIIGIIFHVVSLRQQLVGKYNKVLHMFREGVAQFRTELTGTLHFGIDMPEEELRPFLARRGLSMRTIILAIVSSTLLILAVLAFLLIGFYATTDPTADLSAALGSLLSLGTVGGLSLAKAPVVDELALRQVAELLISDYRRSKDKSTLTFSADDNVLAVIRQAEALFSDKTTAGGIV